MMAFYLQVFAVTEMAEVTLQVFAVAEVAEVAALGGESADVRIQPPAAAAEVDLGGRSRGTAEAQHPGSGGRFVVGISNMAFSKMRM